MKGISRTSRGFFFWLCHSYAWLPHTLYHTANKSLSKVHKTSGTLSSENSYGKDAVSAVHQVSDFSLVPGVFISCGCFGDLFRSVM